MSSRVLRKLQGEKDLEFSHDCEEDEDEFNSSPVKSKKKQKSTVNPFDLLNVDDNGQSEEDSQDNQEEEDAEQNVTEEKPSLTGPAEINSSKKKKRKKKKKGKGDNENAKPRNGRDKIDSAKNNEAKQSQGTEKQVKVPGKALKIEAISLNK